MPAQKRGPEPHESQPKQRKLDEDGEALPSKIGPATNSLITGQMKEKTEAAPRTKKKRSSSGEGETLPAKSSKQDSLPEDSSKTTSDPPLLKAKLLIATSASSGEAPSQRANSNASLKRSASTESEDDLSSDSSKADFFRERDDEDKARCVKTYSNKTKRKAEESSDLHEGLSSSPADPVQIDHNYGRYSDATSPESTEDANEKVSSAESFSEQGKQEMPQNAKENVSTDSSEPETGSIEASVKIDSAAEERKHNEFKDLESHILLDNEASSSSGEVLDTVTPVGEENAKKDQAESIRSQKDVDNETLAQSEETLCSAVVEVTSSGRGDEPADDETDLTFRSESQTHLSAQSVLEEDDQSIRCKFKDGGVAGQPDEVLLNQTTSAPEQVEISNPSIETEENVTTSERVAIPGTQTELKTQVSSAEEIFAAGAVISLCDDVNKALEKSEETLEESDQEAADVPHPVSYPGPLAKREPDHGFVIPDSCTDTSPECKSGHEENQIEVLAEKNLVPEGQMTPEVDLQSQENHLVYDGILKATAEVKEDVISHCSASPDTQIQEDCNPDVTVETQSQEVYESATTLSTYVNEDHVEKLTENKERESRETLAVEASEISDPVPPSAHIHHHDDDDDAADECENSLEHAGPAEVQSAMETQTVEVETQEGPVSESITDEDQKVPENAISTSSEAAECVEATAERLIGVKLQTQTMSEETRNEEMHIQMNQEVSEHSSDIHVEAQRGVQNENCAAQVQISHDVEALVPSEEASNGMEEAGETQMVSKPTADASNEPQTVLEDETFKNCEDSESVSAAVQSQTEVGKDAKAMSEEVPYISPIKVIQSQMVSEPTTDMPEETHSDLENADCVAQNQIEDGVEAEVSSEEASNVMEEAEETQMVSKPMTDASNETQTVWEDAAAAQSQTEVGEEAKATSEEVSNISPMEVIQNHMVSDAHRDLEDANCAVQIQIEDRVETEITSEEASNVASIEEMQTQMVSEPPTDMHEETLKEPESSTLKTSDEMSISAAAPSQTEDQEEAKSTSDEVPKVAHVDQVQTQMVSDPITDMPEETHRDLEDANCVAQIQIEDRVETEITSEEASNVASIEEMQTQMVSEPPTEIPEETLKEPESSTLKTSDGMAVSAAAPSQTEDQEETKSTSDEVPKIAHVDPFQTQMVSEPSTDMPEETHRDLENADCVAQIQTEDGVEAVVSSEESSNVMEEAEETQMVSKPTTDLTNETPTVWDDAAAAAQSQTEVGEEAKITSEEASNVASIIEMQTQMVSEPPTRIPEETHKEPESSTFKTSDEMSVSAAAPSKTEDQEEAKATSEIAPVDQVQTQMVSEPTTHMSDGFLENNEENVKTAKNNEVEFESVAVTPCRMDVEDQSNPASSVGVNENQTEVNTQIAEKSSSTVFVIGSQTQTNLDVGGETKDDTSEDIHEDMMVELPQNMENDDEINSENVTEQGNQTQLETQITAESEIAGAAPLVEMQCEKNHYETSEQVSAEETQNQKSQHVREQITDIASVNVAECQNKTETSLLSAETPIQKSLNVTEPDVPQQQSLRSSSDEDEKVTENQVDVAERPDEPEKQAAEMFEDISQPTSPEPTQSLVDQEVSEVIRDTQGLAETHIQRSQGSPETVKDLPEQVEENARIPSVDIAEMTDKMEVAGALEEVPLPPAMETTQIQRGQEVSEVENDSISTEGEQNIKSVGASENHPITDTQTSAEFDQSQRCEEEADESVDEAASGCENVPEVLMETVSEHQNHLAEETCAASDMKTTLLVNVDTKDDDVQAEPDDVISKPVGSDESNKVKVDEPVSNMEGGAESSDVIVFVCDQSDVQAPEEQIKPKFHDNQVVYEPISSPESNSGEGICTTIELGETISFLELQNTDTHHTVSGESRILTSDDTLEAAHSSQEEEIVKAEICVPESQEAAEMEVDTISEAQLEQSNTTEEFELVAAVSSSDDVSVTEDATEKREIPAEATEQVQEDAAAAPASEEAEVTDGSSEEYVILEPVPENKIHFDIVTQAVAESGLSASLCPADASGEEITSQNALKDPQQAEVKEDETADGGGCPVLTSSRDGLDQEMETNVPRDVPNSYHLPSSTTEETDITNAHSQHIVGDGGLIVVENEKCHLDLQQLQILQDIEIGHEIVVVEVEEVENEENDDVTVIKPPDQPTEDSPEKFVQTVNIKNEPNETTKQSKTEAEKKVTEVPKPKKQEMNTQARTKARLAALAEQKAAASRKSANRQQLNLLALCQEIAEDIATDSMLLKKIEEEKQAAAAEAAAAEARQELPPAVSEEADPVSVAAPAEPEESSGSVTPAPEPSPAQPSTTADDLAETKPAAEPPKRRFFISQISVPLKAHEKKKLTRYQRLRQVELQREKMSWARVKKLKSDQANQMFSDMDWQASFSGGFLMSPATPPPAPSPPKTSPTSPAETSQPAQPKAEAPTAETPTAETPTAETPMAEPAQTGPPKPETSKTEPPKPESSEAEPVKAEKSKTEPPPRENRRSTRQSKALAAQAAAAPTPKVTRSASKKTLPAMPPPMPNGLNAQKQKPVEYKPYRPRPKYSPDDFELDDDDLLLASPARPRPQQSPAAPCKKTPASSQPTNQTRLKPHTAPPGQISGQSKPAAAAQAPLKPAQSKPSVTAAPPPKAAASASAQLKSPEPASPSGRPKPAASAPPQLKTSVGAKPSDPVASETKPAAAADASVPHKTEHLPSQEKEKSQKTADPLPSPLPVVECSKVSDDAEKCEETPAVTTSSSAPENTSEAAETEEQTSEKPHQDSGTKPQDSATHLTEASLQKEVKKLKEADKDSSQTIIDAGQKHFGPVACSMCGMLYSAANPEDESQHLLFHNQFISAVKYVGWKKERILAEFPDGKIILVLPDDPKYALKKVEEIREMVDNDLGFQQVETKCPSQTKTFLFISIDKKVAGCLIAENIQEGYRVIEEPVPEGSEGEKVMFERQRAWCCSTTPEPAICGISRIWVVSMMRRRGIATRMIECLRNNFIYGSYLSKDEIAFSDPTPDGKLFAMHYFGTSQFLVYNFVSGPRSTQPKTHAV